MESEADQIAETHYLIWQGMLTLLINNQSTYSVDEATEMTMKHLHNQLLQMIRKHFIIHIFQ